MLSDEEFQRKFYAAKTHIEKVKLCIQERRFKIAVRRYKPNLHNVECLKAILDLPSSHPHKIKPRKSGEAGSSFVIDFEYTALIAGTEITLYFKGFYGTSGYLKLVVQSLRDAEEA